jgi:general secretion pathway protein M
MKLPAQIKKLNKRERYAIMGAAGVIGIFLIATFIVEPFFNRTNQMKRNLQAKAVMVEQMRQLQSEYAGLTQKEKISKSRFLRREKGFKLYSFLDRLAGEAGIKKDRIIYMKPTTKAQKDSPYKISRVEMKLEAITLEQLTTYLYGVETSRNMVDVKKISISKKDKKQGLITAVLQVETVEI